MKAIIEKIERRAGDSFVVDTYAICPHCGETVAEREFSAGGKTKVFAKSGWASPSWWKKGTCLCGREVYWDSL